jgi:hypothetical protein
MLRRMDGAATTRRTVEARAAVRIGGMTGERNVPSDRRYPVC